MKKDENLDFEENIIEDESIIDDFSDEDISSFKKSSHQKSKKNQSVDKNLTSNSKLDEKVDKDAENLSQNRLKEKLPNYTRANSGSEAYKRTLNNKNYYNNKANEIRNTQTNNRNKLAENQEKSENTQRRLNEAKVKRNSNPIGSRTKEDKNEYKNAKKESKEQLQESKKLDKENKQLKKDEKNILKDSKKAENFKKFHPVKSTEMMFQNKIDKLKKVILLKAAIILSALGLGFFLCVIIVEIILGPLLEAWGNIDQAITNVANFEEKVENFYNGFGFQDSKSAFYDELNELHERYGEDLNIPLLLSTIFYTESQGYDTDYATMEDSDVIDKSINGADNSGIWSAIRSYLKDKFDESNQTVDENGLAYNIGKIYRLRKLARNQFHTDFFGVAHRTGESKSMSLGSFLDMYGTNIARDIRDILRDLASITYEALLTPFKELWALIVGSDYQGDFMDNQGFRVDDFFSSLTQLIEDIFFGLADVTKVYWSWSDLKIKVAYKTFAFDEDNYNKYLNDYYLERMPEFKSMLNGLSGTDRESKKNSIISEIYEHENLFRDIYLEYEDTTTEAYEDSCVGAIDNNLVSNLALPVKINEGTNVKFDESTSFGINNGQMSNGVIINESSTGNKAGDEVYAIAKGKIEEIGKAEEQSNTSTSSSISNYLFIGDSRYVGIKDNLEKLGKNNTVTAVVSSTPSQWESVTLNGSGTVLNEQIKLPSTASGVSVMLGVNSPSQVSNLKTVLTNLHKKYPNAQIYYNSTFHIGTAYTLGYVSNSDIDKLNNSMKSWCESNSWAKYIDITSGLYDSNAYLKSEYTEDGLHLNNSGKVVLVNNIKNNLNSKEVPKENLNTNFIKISHSLDIDNKTYKFYSIYRNIDTSSITLTKGSNVSKGDKIGTIASSSEGSYLYFEFRDNDGTENGVAIDPTNLFIKCSNSVELVGNTTEEKFFNYFVSVGYTKMAAAGIMANIYAESGFVTNNLENTSNDNTGVSDEQFTEMVDNGSITKSEFIFSKKYGLHEYNGDNYPKCLVCTYGYGLMQWTWPDYKDGLYSLYKKGNYPSISDISLQLTYYMNDKDNDLKKIMNSKTSAEDAAEYFVRKYENPQYMENEVIKRRKFAKEFYEKYAN